MFSKFSWGLYLRGNEINLGKIIEGCAGRNLVWRNQRTFHDKETHWLDRFEVAGRNGAAGCTLHKDFEAFSIQGISLNWQDIISPDHWGTSFMKSFLHSSLKDPLLYPIVRLLFFMMFLYLLLFSILVLQLMLVVIWIFIFCICGLCFIWIWWGD